jgi:hypothetical protein
MQMPEAEVSLLLAFWLFNRGLTAGPVQVAIDGAQVKVGDAVHFGIAAFMREHGWSTRVSGGAWQGEWVHRDRPWAILVHSRPGRGDVVSQLRSGETLRAECKKGPLERSNGSKEYPLIREALGQLLTIDEVGARDILAVAVPDSPKFRELASRWRHAPLVKRFGIQIITVSRDGSIAGFEQTG